MLGGEQLQLLGAQHAGIDERFAALIGRQSLGGGVRRRAHLLQSPFLIEDDRGLLLEGS